MQYPWPHRSKEQYENSLEMYIQCDQETCPRQHDTGYQMIEENHPPIDSLGSLLGNYRDGLLQTRWTERDGKIKLNYSKVNSELRGHPKLSTLSNQIKSGLF